MIFVSSWDDGHPLDQRLAELHAKRGLQATFYVPLSNCEGRPVISATGLRTIDAAGFEIGSHTAEHRYLDRLSAAEARRQIEDGKDGLEQMLGHAITGFCFPGGRRPDNALALLQAAGITHARTVENLRIDRDFGAFDVPTTLQFYPHGWQVLLSNTLRAPGHLPRKLVLMVSRASRGRSLAALVGMLESMADEDVVFHLWGHSWEVERLGAWADLGRLLDVAQSVASETLTVAQLSQRRMLR